MPVPLSNQGTGEGADPRNPGVWGSEQGWNPGADGPPGLVRGQQLGRSYEGTQLGASLAIPLSIPGLVAWYDASRITGLSDGAAVATWEDSSGNGNDLTQATAGLRPTYQTGELNGLPIVREDGSDDYMSVDFGASPASQPYSVYMVFRLHTLSGEQEDIVEGTTANTPEMSWNSGNNTAFIWAGGFDPIAFTVDTNFHVFGGVFDGVSSVLDLDGTETVVDAGTNAFSQVMEVGGSVRKTPGDYAELVFYSAELTSAQRQQLRDYFSSKWGV